MAKSKGKPQNLSPRIDNRRARFDYALSDKLECGIQLRGTEVKSIRHGQVSLAEGYVDVNDKTMELWLHNVEIAPYTHAAEHHQHAPKRSRKLLAHRREIAKLLGATTGKGVTIVPIAMYFKHGKVKVEVAVAAGKKQFDKRQDLKKKQSDRDIQRAMTRKVI
ncbi:MAG: SsrA-binding protein SmpB [Planctomycetota bacterium]